MEMDTTFYDTINVIILKTTTSFDYDCTSTILFNYKIITTNTYTVITFKARLYCIWAYLIFK